jgi:Tfp pilus assembly pilus retraction ATPase PilT
VIRAVKNILLARRSGSGMSKTMRSIPLTDSKLIGKYSIEDPVEYFPSVRSPVVIQHDITTRKASELQNKEALSALMRMEPDVAFVHPRRSN